MKATSINDIIAYKNKENLLKTILYVKLSEREYNLSDNDLNLLSLFIDNEDKERVIDISLEKKFVRSKQSGENCVTKLVNLGVLLKTGKKKRKINSEIFPDTNGDVIVCKLTLYNG